MYSADKQLLVKGLHIPYEWRLLYRHVSYGWVDTPKHTPTLYLGYLSLSSSYHSLLLSIHTCYGIRVIFQHGKEGDTHLDCKFTLRSLDRLINTPIQHVVASSVRMHRGRPTSPSLNNLHYTCLEWFKRNPPYGQVLKWVVMEASRS